MTTLERTLETTPSWGKLRKAVQGLPGIGFFQIMWDMNRGYPIIFEDKELIKEQGRPNSEQKELRRDMHRGSTYHHFLVTVIPSTLTALYFIDKYFSK